MNSALDGLDVISQSVLFLLQISHEEWMGERRGRDREREGEGEGGM